MRKNLVRRIPFWFIAIAAVCWSIASHAFVVSIDDFSVVRNGTTLFHDGFGDGVPPPSGPNGAATYGVLGPFPGNAESGGRLLLDSANGVSTFNAIEQARIEQRARLLTNIDPTNLNLGLKSDDTLSLTGIFSLTTPSGLFNPQYSIRFNDFTAGAPHQLVQLQVRLHSTTGLADIRYILQDFDANTITVLGSALFAPPVGADEILLNINRPDTANDNAFGSFDYLAAGLSVGGGATFVTPAHMFQVENFVRAEFNVSDAIPEPESYAMLLAGLGLLGFVARRRIQKPV
jgi:hypothetical protein